MSSETLVLVVTHKPFDQHVVPAEGYQVIKVGNRLSSEEARSLGFWTDDTGDHISGENPFYCELTAQYWAWKNLDKSIKNVGISHYRRYFFDYTQKSKTWAEDIVSAAQIEEILKTHKAIISFYSVKYPGFSMLYRHRPDDQQDKHWLVIRDIIKESYPEMFSFFMHRMAGRKTVYGNMLIAGRDVFDAYCTWLFDVLQKYDEVLKKRGEDRIPRVDGYLAEPLLLVWMEYHLRKEDIYHLEVRNTEADHFYDYRHSLPGRLFGSLRHNRPTLILLQKLKVLYFYITRR